jgi:hypothetical protein
VENQMTETIVVDPEITKAVIMGWTGKEMLLALSDPDKKLKIEAALAAPIIPTPEEQALIDGEAAQLAQEAEAVAAATRELERIKVEEAAKLAELAKAAIPEKVVMEYQVDDGQGNPIGRPTHLEANSWKEMAEKVKVCHSEATRAFNRVKNQKATFNKPAEPENVPMTDEQLLAEAAKLRSDDPAEVLEANRNLLNAQLEKERTAARIAEAKANGIYLSYTFMMKHPHDFNPCTANSQVISNYITEHDMEWTLENLEIAFDACYDNLAPVVKPKESVIPEIERPAVVNTPAPVQAAVPPVTAPVVPEVPPVAPPNAPAVVRRRPDGGLIPGETLTGVKPLVKPTGLTKKDIAKWSGPEMRKEMKDPKRRAEIEAVLNSRPIPS